MKRRLPTTGILALLAACAADPVAAPLPPAAMLRVAACQILVDGDREAAFERIELALVQASEQGADIACFPETCLLGWLNPIAHEVAGPIPGPSTNRLAELAREYGLMIAIGLAEQDAGRLYDSAILIDLDGTLLLHHRKVNLISGLMDPPYSPGSGAFDSFADTRHGRIGLLICADTFDEELVDELAAVEPDLVLVPYGWAAPEEEWPAHGESLLAWISSTARRVQAPILGVDSTGVITHGPWKGHVLGGQSAFSDPSGTIQRPLADRAVEVRVFEVPSRSSVIAQAPISFEGWRGERIVFPPAFAPSLPAGVEDLLFAPGMFDPAAPDYWTYALFMQVQTDGLGLKQLTEFLEAYFDGLLQAVASGKGENLGDNPSRVSLESVGPANFEGRVQLIDAFVTLKPVEVHLRIRVNPLNDGGTHIEIEASPQPMTHELWRALEAAVEQLRLEATSGL